MAITKVTGALLGNYTGGSADDTVVVGDGAGDAITTGVDNTLIGDNAGTALTEGSDNVAVGNEALAANTTGANNVAIGRDALLANTTASSNVAVGMECLKTVTTGTGNVAVGFQALKTNTGSNNTARYFNSYFKNKPSIIRNNRNSIAILNGNESKNDLKILSFEVLNLN